MAFILGADPGKGGGLALLDDDGRFVLATKMPEGDQELAIWLATAKGHAAAAGSTIRGWTEQVFASPQMGVVSAFTFGQQVGRLRMALAGTGIPTTAVVPVKWQNALQCRTGGDKTITRARAIALFPDVKVTHHIADALLIASYGYRHNRGLVPLSTR